MSDSILGLGSEQYIPLRGLIMDRGRKKKWGQIHVVILGVSKFYKENRRE